MLTTDKKIEKKLEQISCIQYSMIFKDQTKALLLSKIEVNIMSQAFTYQLGHKIRKTNIVTLKIDSTILEISEILVFIFSILDKESRERFFEKSFLLTDIKLDIVLGISFLAISNTNIDFQARNLQQRSYTIKDKLLTTKKVELIRKKIFQQQFITWNIRPSQYM